MQAPAIILLALIATLTSAASLIGQPAVNLTSFLNPNRLTFSQVVSAGAAIVYSRYSSAILVEIQATTRLRPTTLPKRLTDVRLIFSVNGPPPYRTVLIEMNNAGWGVWYDPHLAETPPPIMNGAVPLPLRMDLLEADQLMKEAGYAGRYWGVSVAWPLQLAAAQMQVVYSFDMQSDNPWQVAVYTKDRVVRPVQRPDTLTSVER